jgi:hypothetical protein
MNTGDRLTDLLIRRDAVEEALATGQDYIELEVRGRRVRLQGSLQVLAYLNEQIDLERHRIDQRARPARNTARVVR